MLTLITDRKLILEDTQSLIFRVKEMNEVN